MSEHSQSDMMKERWKDPEYRKQMLEMHKKMVDERMRKRINELGGKKK